MSDLHTKVKDVEDEKKSLITAIELLQADFDNNINKPVHIESDDIPKDADEAFLVTSNSNPKHVVSFSIFSVLDDNVDGRDQGVKGDLSAIKVSQPTQTETLNSYMIQPKRNVQLGGKGKNNFQLKQNIPIAPKHTVPCPFLREKGRCLKGSSCDCFHDKHLYQPVVARENELDFFYPFLQNFQGAMEKINQVELRLRRIEDIGASSQRSPPSIAPNQHSNSRYPQSMPTYRPLSQPSPPSIVPNQHSNSRYPQSMPTYRQPWSESPYQPRPLMEILTSQPPSHHHVGPP